MAAKTWTEDEWAFLLSCFYQSPSFDEAMKAYNMHYKRKKQAVVNKFKKEGMDAESYVGSGLRKKRNRISKKYLIKELKQVYKILEEPFNEAQFDEMSATDAETVNEIFGDWETALQAASLTKKFENHQNIEEEIKGFDPDVAPKKTWAKQKTKLLNKAEERKIKYLRDQAHKVDVVKEMIEEAVAKADPLIVEIHRSPKKKAKSKAQITAERDNCTLWFEFSDLQLGTLMTSEEMGGLNKHNWVIWQDKLRIWKEQVIDKIKSYSNTHIIDRIVIACLGDMVEGSDIFKGQVWKIDRNVVDQAIEGANDTSAAFAEILLTFPEHHFDILEVFGNHGRIGRKGDNPYAMSMDKVYQRMLEGQLNTVNNLTNYTYHRNEAWFYFVEVYGWNHLLLHGDQGMNKLWSGRPTINGLEKGVVRYNQMFQQQVHFLHSGHFHSDWQLSFNLTNILINGSFIGTSSFSATQMVASSPPIQVLHIFEPRIGLAKTERIYLAEGDIKKPIKPRTLEKGVS